MRMLAPALARPRALLAGHIIWAGYDDVITSMRHALALALCGRHVVSMSMHDMSMSMHDMRPERAVCGHDSAGSSSISR